MIQELVIYIAWSLIISSAPLGPSGTISAENQRHDWMLTGLLRICQSLTIINPWQSGNIFQTEIVECYGS